MSDQDQKYTATLHRGETFYLLDTRFDRGVAVVVTEAQKDYLEQNAYDEITGEYNEETGEQEITYKAKFAFAEYDGKVAAGNPINGPQAEAPVQRHIEPVPQATARPAARQRTR